PLRRRSRRQRPGQERAGAAGGPQKAGAPMNRLHLALGAVLLAGCARGSELADLVAFGPVWTGDSAMPTATAVAVRGERIVAVGDSATIATMVGESTTVITTTGLITPGFADGHVHLD